MKDKTRFAHSRTHKPAGHSTHTHAHQLVSVSSERTSSYAARTSSPLPSTNEDIFSGITDRGGTNEREQRREKCSTVTSEGKAVAQVGVMEQCVGGANYAPPAHAQLRELPATQKLPILYTGPNTLKKAAMSQY